MNWHRIRNYFPGRDLRESFPSVAPEELEAVDQLYRATPRIEPRPGFRAAVHRRVDASPSAGVSENKLHFWGQWAPRPLLAGATGLAILLLALTAFWGGRSQAHAAPIVVCEIQGMICQGCAQQVGEILGRVPGVRSAQVDAKTARARVVLQPGVAVSVKQLSAALEQTKHFRISDVSIVMEQP